MLLLLVYGIERIVIQSIQYRLVKDKAFGRQIRLIGGKNIAQTVPREKRFHYPENPVVRDHRNIPVWSVYIQQKTGHTLN